MERARKIWDEIGMPPISPQPPWHGYPLGDWADDWETYAQRAVTGDWEKERQGNLRAAPRRADARNTGARRGVQE